MLTSWLMKAKKSPWQTHAVGKHLDGRMQAVFADCAMTRVQSCKLFKRLVSVSSFRWHEIGNQGPQG